MLLTLFPAFTCTELHNDPPEGINAAPKSDNILHWNAVIFGPQNTIWDGGVFKLTIEFSEDYPNKPPVVKYISKIFHPNGKIGSGLVCWFLLF